MDRGILHIWTWSFSFLLTPFFKKKLKFYFVSKQPHNIREEKRALDTTTKASIIEARYYEIKKQNLAKTPYKRCSSRTI
jgi:hypothetical protein